MTARVLGVLLVLGVGACRPGGAPDPLTGAWEGTATLGAYTLDARLAFRSAGDSLRGTLSSEAEMLLAEPLRGVRGGGGRVRFEAGPPDEALVFEGTVRGDSLVLRGRPVRPGGEGPAGGVIRLARRAGAAPPPYAEVPLAVTNGNIRLAGTLFVPAGPGPHPAVVLLHGSTLNAAHAYRYYADRFARAGIAAYVYDKRGTGASTGSLDRASFYDLAADAHVVVERLAQQPGLDARRIGLWGLSQGAYLAPLVAQRTPRVAFVVTVSGGGGSIADAAAYQDSLRLRQRGFSAADGAAAARLDRAFGGWLHAGGDAGMRAALAAADAAAWRRFVDVPRTIPSPAARRWWYWQGRGYDALAPWSTLRVPLLAVFGDADDLVPARQSAARLAAALRAARHPDATVCVFERAGHMLKRPPSALRSGEAPGATPGYPDTVTAWVRRRAGLVRSGRPG